MLYKELPGLRSPGMAADEGNGSPTFTVSEICLNEGTHRYRDG